MRNKLFDIHFGIPLEGRRQQAYVEAKSELSEDNEYYNIHSYKVENSDIDLNLMPMKIKHVKNDTELQWLHVDSEKESVLSVAAGKSIENSSVGKYFIIRSFLQENDMPQKCMISGQEFNLNQKIL